MSKRIVEKGTGRELSENLNYTGMEKGVRVLALRDKLAFAEEIAVMSELDVCNLISEHYEMVFSESENVGLVKKENAQKLFMMLEVISR